MLFNLSGVSLRIIIPASSDQEDKMSWKKYAGCIADMVDREYNRQYVCSVVSFLQLPLQMLLPELVHGLIQMVCGVVPLRYAVGTHGIGELVEHLVLPDQFIDQHLAALVVNVVVARAVDQQQVALESAREVDG